MISRLFIGSDVSKEWFDIWLQVAGHIYALRFANTQEGIRAFTQWAWSFGAKKVFVCMEHTGGYEMELALGCRESGFCVSLVDGGAISRYRSSFGRAKAKTDLTDAKLIARYLEDRKPAEWSPRPEEYRILTELVRHRDDLIESRKAWERRSDRPSLSESVSAQRNAFVELLKLQIKETDSQINAHLKAHTGLEEDALLLESITGIARTSAVRILSEMGPVSNYRTPRDLALAAGLCPIVSQSGKRAGKSRLPTYGNAELRKALYWPVIVAMRCKAGIAPFTERVKENAEKSKMTVITAGMRKLAHVIFGVLKSRTPFDQEKFLKDMKQTP